MDLILLSWTEDRERQIEPIDFSHENSINGLETFSFTCEDSEEFPVTKNKRIIYQDELGTWNEFIIVEVEKRHSAEGIILSVLAESSIVETFGDYIEDKRPTNQTAGGALAIALQGTRWSFGQSNITELKSAMFYRCSVHDAISKIIEVWGGEIRTRITVSGNRVTARYVDLFSRRGEDRGRRFEWTKDITDITRKVSDRQIVTALYGYGKGQEIGDGFSRRIDFAAINGGKAYVENTAARDIYGPLNANGTHRHIFSKFECDLETPEEVLAETRKQLEAISEAEVIYAAKVVNLAKYGFIYEGVELGDDVTIIDSEIGSIQARVMRIVKRPDHEEDEITLGRYREAYAERMAANSAKIADFAARAGIWDRAKSFDAEGKLGADFLKDILAAFNGELNASGGWVYAEPGKGLITYNKPEEQNPTGATQLLAAGLRIASGKLADGSWDWRTAITSMGIIADVIYTGKIVGQTSYYDLDAGVMSFRAILSGKQVEVKLSVSQGFEIFANGQKIGGLGIVNGRVMLLASAISNDADKVYAEVGKFSSGGSTDHGIKISFKDSNNVSHILEIGARGTSTNGAVSFRCDGKSVGFLGTGMFDFNAKGTSLSGKRYLAIVQADFSEFLIGNCLYNSTNSSQMPEMCDKGGFMKIAENLFTIESKENFRVNAKKGGFGVDENGPYYINNGTKKYLT